jgi:hypothetical protein
MSSMPKNEQGRPSTPDQLATSRPARNARQRLGRHEKYLNLLERARRLRLDSGLPADLLEQTLKQAQDELPNLTEATAGPIWPRARPKKIETPETCTIYIDECGGHNFTAKERFGAFCVAAVIIRDSDWPNVDREWKAWKQVFLGSESKRVHEPDIRDGNLSFWCGGDALKRQRAIDALPDILGRLSFGAVACVFHRVEYAERIGKGRWDESLPDQAYLMAVDFVIERLAMALYYQLDGAQARVVWESREPAQDARVQYEFARLFLDGTSYVSPSFIRQQLKPGLEFQTKESNNTGLQLADLLARPVAEKILDPASTPERWLAFRTKLCPEQRTGNSILGLKIVPWDDKYAGIWKS